MPIAVVWDNEEKTVVRFDVHGIWTAEDADISRLLMFKFCDSVIHRVDAIWYWVDSESRTRVPMGAMRVLTAMQRSPHPRRGKIVTVPRRYDMVGRIWLDVISKALPHLRAQIMGADTLEEARVLLKGLREKV